MKLAPEGGNLVVGEIFNIFSLAGNFRHRHPPPPPAASPPQIQILAGLPLLVSRREKATGQLGSEWVWEDSRVLGASPDPQQKGATGPVRGGCLAHPLGWGVCVAPRGHFGVPRISIQ